MRDPPMQTVDRVDLFDETDEEPKDGKFRTIFVWKKK
jgi:hypothetical protein